jgi:hypothetical protein
MAKEKLTWRTFNDVGTEGFGPIATTWNLQGTPTLILLDHKGVIRFRWVGSPGAKKIDEAIGRLIKEAGGDRKKGSR